MRDWALFAVLVVAVIVMVSSTYVQFGSTLGLSASLVGGLIVAWLIPGRV